MVVVELCIDSVASAVAAEQGGANRAELCACLFEGGLTPSVGMIQAVRSRIKIPLFVLIRPRAGDFCYDEAEFDIIKTDVVEARLNGANGIVVGVLTEEGDIDVERMKVLITLAHPLPITFHRAFDMTRDANSALQELINLGIPRVLTSGQERSAIEGLDMIKQLIEMAGDKIIVMPGGGVSDRNVHKLVLVGAQEVHLSASSHFAIHNPICSSTCNSKTLAHN
eukprot:Phypoly_transcript_11833.p1 GENE.Phypoly_transcript_11833~~Phypoly_transcript_11833.p1  ORF type:complete len:224 (+),score=10.83 Phypoly_transcript_11833:281-952(+)